MLQNQIESQTGHLIYRYLHWYVLYILLTPPYLGEEQCGFDEKCGFVHDKGTPMWKTTLHECGKQGYTSAEDNGTFYTFNYILAHSRKCFYTLVCYSICYTILVHSSMGEYILVNLVLSTTSIHSSIYYGILVHSSTF